MTSENESSFLSELYSIMSIFLSEIYSIMNHLSYMWIQRPAVHGSGGESKVQCCKEQYCIGTWNVRSMNQGKLEVVKQEMERVNINVLGISELKWTKLGEFNSDDHYIYYCGQDSLRRNGVALIVNKRSEMQYLCAISKKTEWPLFMSKATHLIS